MLNLKQYKNYLINKFDFDMDNMNEKRFFRKIMLENQYSDEELIGIIRDTYSFTLDLLDSDNIKDGSCKIPVKEDNTKKINLGLTGNHPSDILFYDNEGRSISKYVTKELFGDYFYIDLLSIEYEKEDDIVSSYNDYYIYMQGIPDNIEKLKKDVNMVLEENKELVLSKKNIK